MTIFLHVFLGKISFLPIITELDKFKTVIQKFTKQILTITCQSG